MIEKYRVSEVAKDLGTPSKELIALLDGQFPEDQIFRIYVSVHSDFVSADEAKEMAESFQSRNFEQVAHGKTLVLTIRGLIHYGFDKIAY